MKHIERTGVLIHVLDVSGSENRDPLEDFYKINEELYNYNEKLRDKTQIIFANKMDIPSRKENLEKLKKALSSKYQIIEGSAATGENVKLLMQKAYQLVQEKGIDYKTYDKAYVENKVREEAITVRKENDDYIVEGPYIDKLMRSTNFNDYESLKYFQENLRKNNVIEKLKSLGIEEGQSVNIGGYEFEFFN